MTSGQLTVTRLGTVPVKGTRWRPAERLRVGPDGPEGDRAFFIVEPDGTLVKTSRTPRLTRITTAFDPDAGTLALTFPNGETVVAPAVLGAAATTHNYEGRPIPGRLLDGPFGAALSDYLGRPAELLARDEGTFGADDAPVSLMCEETVAALGPHLTEVPDERRFRMNIVLSGAPAWTEHGWTGAEIELGEAVLRVIDAIPRCVVTTRDPDTGRRDAPVLKTLAALRGRRDVTLGVWCEVVRPGTIRRGDAVSVTA